MELSIDLIWNGEFMFLLCTQVLRTHVVDTCAIQGISIAGRDAIISQLADETTIFKTKLQAIHVINNFSQASGL